MSTIDSQQVVSDGFEALQRLYVLARGNSGQCKTVAKFLLGLYNDIRFPFPLTDLRGIDDAIFADCMLVLAMDARVCIKEIHNYFEHGGRKFEALAKDWDIEDIHRLRERAARGESVEQEPAQPVEATDYSAKLVSYGMSPGYRSLSVTVDLLPIGAPPGIPPAPVRACLSFDAPSSVAIFENLREANKLAWGPPGGSKRPLDAKPHETRPTWL